MTGFYIWLFPNNYVLPRTNEDNPRKFNMMFNTMVIIIIIIIIIYFRTEEDGFDWSSRVTFNT